MRCRDIIIRKFLKAFCITVFMSLINLVNAQVPVSAYGIKDGKMFIAVGKSIQKKSR